MKYFGLSFEDRKMKIKDLKKYINKKIPIIIAIQAWKDKKNKIDWKNDWKDGHYVAVIGYDDKKIYFGDPSSEKTTFLTYNQLEERWHDKDTKHKKVINWGLAIKRSKYSKNPHQMISIDYKEPRKIYRYNNQKIIPMD